MALPVSGVLNLTNREKVKESKAIELAKPPPTTATFDRHILFPMPPQNVGSFTPAATGGVVAVTLRVGTCPAVEGADRLKEEFDRAVRITVFHHRLAKQSPIGILILSRWWWWWQDSKSPDIWWLPSEIAEAPVLR